MAKWERDEANSQRSRAEANVQLALQALEEIYIEVAENRFPKDQLTEAAPTGSDPESATRSRTRS